MVLRWREHLRRDWCDLLDLHDRTARSAGPSLSHPCCGVCAIRSSLTTGQTDLLLACCFETVCSGACRSIIMGKCKICRADRGYLHRG